MESKLNPHWPWLEYRWNLINEDNEYKGTSFFLISFAWKFKIKGKEELIDELIVKCIYSYVTKFKFQEIDILYSSFYEKR